MTLKKNRECYITFLSDDQCEEFSNQIDKFEHGLIPFTECLICKEQFFEINEADEHRKSIHPIAKASKDHKLNYTTTMESYTLTTKRRLIK